MAANWETLQVSDGTTTQAYVASPDGPGPFPGVVISQHLGGIDQFIQETAVRLAGEGYVAIAPDLYHRLDPVEGESTPEKLLARLVNLTDVGVIADTNAAIDYLKASPLCTDGIGLVGFCMGGRIAYMMAGVNSGLKAVISFYRLQDQGKLGNRPPPDPLRAPGRRLLPNPRLLRRGRQGPQPGADAGAFGGARQTRQAPRVPLLPERGPRLHELHEPAGLSGGRRQGVMARRDGVLRTVSGQGACGQLGARGHLLEERQQSPTRGGTND